MIKSFTASGEVLPLKFVKFDGDGVSSASSASDNIIGVSGDNYVPENEAADVYLTGETTEITAGGAFSAGDILTADDEGRAIEASTTENIGAIALESAENEGDIVKVVVTIQRNSEASTEDDTVTDDDTTDTDETTDDDTTDTTDTDSDTEE